MKTQNQTHTPGPWHIGFRAFERAIYGPKGEEVCAFTGMTEPGEELANAQFIVRACNAHDDLLAALETAASYLEKHRPKGRIQEIFSELNAYENDVMRPARAAIAKAKGGAS